MQVSNVVEVTPPAGRERIKALMNGHHVSSSHNGNIERILLIKPHVRITHQKESYLHLANILTDLKVELGGGAV